MRDAPSERGGWTNRYDAENAWTDDTGALHLQIAPSSDSWTCAEVILTRSLGYGSYSFVVRDVTHLPPTVVLGLFTWDDVAGDQRFREMDVEISRWGDPANANAQYVVQPYYVPANVSRFQAPAGTLTHTLRWEVGGASFRTVRGVPGSAAPRVVAEHSFTHRRPTAGQRDGSHQLLRVRVPTPDAPAPDGGGRPVVRVPAVTKSRSRTALALAALAGASSAQALDPTRPIARYQRESWSAEHGFPGGGVHAITQGKDGYLWLGTERGLVRFDGTEFRLVPGQGAVSAGGPDILGAVVDASGSLWLRPDRPALLRHRDSGFESVPFATDPREVAVTAMTLGRSGELLVYAQLSGLMAWRGERFERMALETIPSSIVLSMAETPDGTLFLGHARRRPVPAARRPHRAAADGTPGPQGQLPARGLRTRSLGRHRPRHRALERERAHAGWRAAGAARRTGAGARPRPRPERVGGHEHGPAARQRARGRRARGARAVPWRRGDRDLRGPRRGPVARRGLGDRAAPRHALHDLFARPRLAVGRSGGDPRRPRGPRLVLSARGRTLPARERAGRARRGLWPRERSRLLDRGGPRRTVDWPAARRADAPSLRGPDASRAQLHRGRRAQPIERLRRPRKPRRERLGGHAQRRALPPARGSRRDLHDRRWLAFQQRQRARRDCRRHVVGGHAPGSRRAVGRSLDHAPHHGRAALGQRERARRGLARRALDRHGRRPRVPALRARRGARPRARAAARGGRRPGRERGRLALDRHRAARDAREARAAAAPGDTRRGGHRELRARGRPARARGRAASPFRRRRPARAHLDLHEPRLVGRESARAPWPSGRRRSSTSARCSPTTSRSTSPAPCGCLPARSASGSRTPASPSRRRSAFAFAIASTASRRTGASRSRPRTPCTRIWLLARTSFASRRRAPTGCGTVRKPWWRSRSHRPCGRRCGSGSRPCWRWPWPRGCSTPGAWARRRGGSTSPSRSAWRSGPGSPGSCTTRCCRAS